MPTLSSQVKECFNKGFRPGGSLRRSEVFFQTTRLLGAANRGSHQWLSIPKQEVVSVNCKEPYDPQMLKASGSVGFCKTRGSILPLQLGNSCERQLCSLVTRNENEVRRLDRGQFASWTIQKGVWRSSSVVQRHPDGRMVPVSFSFGPWVASTRSYPASTWTSWRPRPFNSRRSSLFKPRARCSSGLERTLVLELDLGIFVSLLFCILLNLND